ncbi:FAD-dependent oxidoreductase [Candidatus Saccharibacteria bacterium]|nr:FAD-dependent oxidoreductase [Candidatus Saccharibacteria bacterium]
MYDIIIVGAGMAGLTAGIYAARAGKKALILESGAVGGQILTAPKLENWPGNFGVSGADLMKNIHKQATGLGVETEYEEVEKIEKKNDKFLVVTDENEYTTSAVILATGTVPRKLSEKQTKDAGNRAISYCATCDGALYKGKPVVVVGSGNTAKQEISYLRNIASKVYHIHHDDPIPDDAEAVFVAIGRIPATDAFSDLVELDQDGYIVAKEDCKTSCAGVFVAGDCRTKNTRQLVTAAGDAAVAAEQAVKYLG